MKWQGADQIQLEANEPAFRTCHACNAAHWHLKYTRCVMVCPECDRYWVLGRYMDDPRFEEPGGDAAFWAGAWGMKPGDSTSGISDEVVRAAETADPELRRWLERDETAP